MKNKSGITLIALIISIIVLVILAGVTVATLTGENGLLSKAKNAAEDTKFQKHLEEVETEVTIAFTEYYDRNSSSFSDTLIELCQKKGYTVENKIESTGLGELILTSEDGYEIIIDINNNKREAKVNKDESGAIVYDASITFDSNTGTGTMKNQPARIGKELILRDATFEKEGYAFIGWSLTQSGEVLENNKITNVTGDMTLYAIWAEAYTITFGSNGGTGTMNQINVPKGQTISLPVNTFVNSTPAIGWLNQDGDFYSNEQNVVINKDLTLTAQWLVEPYDCTKENNVFNDLFTVVSRQSNVGYGIANNTNYVYFNGNIGTYNRGTFRSKQLINFKTYTKLHFIVESSSRTNHLYYGITDSNGTAIRSTDTNATGDIEINLSDITKSGYVYVQVDWSSTYISKIYLDYN